VPVSHLGVWERRIGLRSARRQWLAEQIRAIERREQTKPPTLEYKRFHLAARLEANCHKGAVASMPCRGGEGTVLGYAEGTIFLLLFLLVSLEDFLQGFVAVQWGVCVSDPDVKDCSRASGPEAVDGNIATEFWAGSVWVDPVT
jgi:hypothetical protein